MENYEFQPDTNAMSEAPSPPSSLRSADLIRPLINQYLQIKSWESGKEGKEEERENSRRMNSLSLSLFLLALDEN